MGRKQWETIVANAIRQSLVPTRQLGVAVPDIAANGGVFLSEIYAPVSTIGIVQSMYLEIQGQNPGQQGATTGGLFIKIGTTQSSGSAIAATYNKDNGASTVASSSAAILFNHMRWYNQIDQEPPDTAGVVSALRGYTFDSSLGLRLAIFNNSNAVLKNLFVNWYVNWLKVESA